MEQPNYPFPNKPFGALHPAYPAIRKKPRAFKILLNSYDREGGTLQAPVFRVNLPDTFIAKRLYLSVDTLVHATLPASNTNVDLYPTMVTIRELRNPYSWSSTSKQPHGVLQVTGTRNFQNAQPRDESSCTVVDRTLFDRPITVELTSAYYNVTGTNGIANDWSVMLSVWDAGEDN